MKIENEREWLSFMHGVNAVSEESISQFLQKMQPHIEAFILSRKESDQYKGWAFDISIAKDNMPLCSRDLKGIFDGWSCFKIGRDDVSLRKEDLTISTHMHSFLWSF